jgi:hypothetical protein
MSKRLQLPASTPDAFSKQALCSQYWFAILKEEAGGGKLAFFGERVYSGITEEAADVQND